MAKVTAGGKIYATFTIDETVKKRFNLACTMLDLGMSQVVENMMLNFLDISESMARKAADSLQKVHELDNPIEVVDHTINAESAEVVEGGKNGQ